MKYLILLVLALATVCEAKEAKPCLELKQMEVTKLHPAETITATVTFNKRCPVEIEPQSNEPTSPVELHEIYGLSTKVDEIRQVESEDKIQIDFTLKTQIDLPRGDYELHGFVHYKRKMSESSADETLPFALPVKVLKPDTINAREREDQSWTETLVNVAIGVAVIVFFPVAVVLYMVGNGPC
jgi:hypothetical protein